MGDGIDEVVVFARGERGELIEGKLKPMSLRWEVDGAGLNHGRCTRGAGNFALVGLDPDDVGDLLAEHLDHRLTIGGTFHQHGSGDEPVHPLLQGLHGAHHINALIEHIDHIKGGIIPLANGCNGHEVRGGGCGERAVHAEDDALVAR